MRALLALHAMLGVGVLAASARVRRRGFAVP